MKYAALYIVVGVTFFAGVAHGTTQTSEWVIKDAKLRSETLEAMKEYLQFVRHDSVGAAFLTYQSQEEDLVVTALENTDDNTRQLISIQYDTILIASTDKLRAMLGEDIYNFIAGRSSYAYDLNRTAPEERLCGYLWQNPERITLALDDQEARISPTYTIVDEIGNSSVQMPWWEYGMFRVGVANTYFKLLFQGPFSPGLQRVWFVDKRLMDGAFGGSLEFNVEDWSGEIAFATMSKQTSLYGAFIYPPIANYVSFIGQLVYSFAEPVEPLGAVQLSFGGGMHVVKHDSITPPPGWLAIDAANPSTTIISPIVKISFVSTHDDAELSAQYYNTSILFQVKLHIAGPFWISGSALKISGLRIPQPYEPGDFLFVTPMLRW